VAKALRCQKAEHTFADTPCGIMDQYISAMGLKGSLLLIDCRTNSFELIPFGAATTGTASSSPIILVTNSLVKHTLSGSEYPDRVRQCKEAVAAIKMKYPIVEALRDANLDMLDSVQEELSDVVYRRAKHVIGEDIRTQSAVAALKKGDYVTVGQLMTASHYSLKDDYEVSCDELDFLVEVANKVHANDSSFT
jgi:galactokinase